VKHGSPEEVGIQFLTVSSPGGGGFLTPLDGGNMSRFWLQRISSGGDFGFAGQTPNVRRFPPRHSQGGCHTVADPRGVTHAHAYGVQVNAPGAPATAAASEHPFHPLPKSPTRRVSQRMPCRRGGWGLLSRRVWPHYACVRTQRPCQRKCSARLPHIKSDSSQYVSTFDRQTRLRSHPHPASQNLQFRRIT